MKKSIYILLSILLIFILASCRNEDTPTEVPTEIPTVTPAESTVNPVTDDATIQTENHENTEIVSEIFPQSVGATYVYEDVSYDGEVMEYFISSNFVKDLGEETIQQFMYYAGTEVIYSFDLICTDDSIEYLLTDPKTAEEITKPWLENEMKNSEHYTLLKMPLDESSSWESSYTITDEYDNGNTLDFNCNVYCEVIDPTTEIESLLGDLTAIKVLHSNDQTYTSIRYYVPEIGLVKEDIIDNTDNIASTRNLVRIEDFNNEYNGVYYETLNIMPSTMETEPEIAGKDQEPVDTFKDFMVEQNPKILEMDEIFYTEKDIDHDGYVEAIAAFGTINNTYNENEIGIDNIIEDTFVVRNKDGAMELIAHDFLIDDGYAGYKMDLVKFEDEEDYFIYVDKSNGAYMHGLEIFRLVGDDLLNIEHTVSPECDCDVYLFDQDHDSLYEGYYVDQLSYDVLYFYTQTFFEYTDGDFVRKESHVQIPVYPDTIEGVVTQFMSLKILAQTHPSKDIDKRLNEICIYPENDHSEISYDIWYPEVVEELSNTDYSLTIGVTENGDYADALVKNTDEINYKVNQLNIQLIFDGDKWRIVSVEEAETLI